MTASPSPRQPSSSACAPPVWIRAWVGMLAALAILLAAAVSHA